MDGSRAHGEAMREKDIGRDIDASLVTILKGMRGHDTSRKPRGAKVPAGRPIQIGNVGTSRGALGARAIVIILDESTTSEENESDDECGICSMEFKNSSGAD